MEPAAKPNRIIYIDILRILSIVAVIALHTTADLLIRSTDFNSSSWWFSNILNSIARFAVPVFFMISGAMMLKVNVTSYRSFYIKRILPLFLALVSWSIIYDLYNQFYILKYELTLWQYVPGFGYRLIMNQNYVHLWFLYVIIAIYMTVPLISKLVKVCGEKDLRYFIIGWFTISIVYQLISDTVVRVTGQSLYIISMNIPLFTGFLGYFVLGYYLFHYELPQRVKHVLFNIGVASFFITPIATYFVSQYKGSLDEMFYGNFSITTFFMAVAVYLYYQEKETSMHENLNHKIHIVIGSLSKASFSIYLIHLLVELAISRRVEVDASFLRVSVSLVFNVVAIFLISYVTVKVLHLNKYVTKLLFGGRG
ncbi:acyltransferase [Paenibacillus agilis]|uniref:Acyltransferase family protein n=1 Tax=Paenibacillus agilis TaxID=3020863 RepID=A0A559J114_9BACL|nr:acyltransferase family protein [Paenibacillus agilis]TVX93579.1 acyltransferase family protein [Paenibacillus agilis]